VAIFRNNGYLRLRRGLFEHVANGQMTAMECFLYTAILANADPSTGIWHSSAGCLAALYSISPRTCRDSLERLEKGGYLKRFPIRGKHGQYPILVHRFDCSDGAMKGMRLNAMESLSWETPIYESCDEGAATVPERGRGECRSERDDSATKYLETRDYETRDKIKPLEATPLPGPRPEEFANVWNAGRGPLPKVETFTDGRRKKVIARIRSGVTLERFTQAVECCRTKPFLMGDNDRGWTATFDWLIANGENIEKSILNPYSGPTVRGPRQTAKEAKRKAFMEAPSA